MMVILRQILYCFAPPKKSSSMSLPHVSSSLPVSSVCPSLLCPGPPSKPVGPLKAKDVERTSVTLEWQPPSDDGGSPLTGYVLEKRDTARPTWTRVEKLSAGKTSYKVQNLLEGSDYHFRVTAENKHGTSEPLETEKTVKPKSPFGESVVQLPLLFFLLVFVQWKNCIGLNSIYSRKYINNIQMLHRNTTSRACNGISRKRRSQYTDIVYVHKHG